MESELIISIKPTNLFLSREMEINDPILGFVKGIFIPYDANETKQDKHGNEYLQFVMSQKPNSNNEYLLFQKFSNEHIGKLKFAGYERPKLVGRGFKVKKY